MNAYLRSRTDEQRTDIKSGTAFVRRNETFVRFYYLAHGFAKQLGGKFGHQNAPAGALQTLGIGLRTEHTDFAVLAAECLQSFERLLPVVQASSRHVDIQRFFRTQFQFSPFAVAVIATHVVICLHIPERQISPIDFFHTIIYILMLMFPFSGSPQITQIKIINN